MEKGTVLPRNCVHIVYDMTDEFEEGTDKLRVTFKDNEELKIPSEGDKNLPLPCYKSYVPYMCKSECENCRKIFTGEIQLDDGRGGIEHNINRADIGMNSDNNNNDNDILTTVSDLNNSNCDIPHTNMAHNHFTLFDCFTCDEQFEKHEDRINHLENVHVINNSVSCKMCDEYIDFKSIASHVVECKATKEYQCRYCPRRFLSSIFQGYHEKEHNQKCPYCKECFFLSSDYVEHVKTAHHKKLNKSSINNVHITEQNTIEVPLSKFEERFKELLRSVTNDSVIEDNDLVHSKPLVGSNKEIGSPQDKKKDKDQQISKKRKRIRFLNIGNYKKRIQVRCNDCSRIFNNCKRLESHCKVVHNSSKPYVCHSCDESFASAKQRTRHLTIKHGSKRNILCKFCCNYLETETKMNAHMLHCTRRVNKIKHDAIDSAASSNDKLICEQCNAELVTNYALNLHKVLYHGSSYEKSTAIQSSDYIQLQSQPKFTSTLQKDNKNSDSSTEDIINISLLNDSDDELDSVKTQILSNEALNLSICPMEKHCNIKEYRELSLGDQKMVEKESIEQLQVELEDASSELFHKSPSQIDDTLPGGELSYKNSQLPPLELVVSADSSSSSRVNVDLCDIIAQEKERSAIERDVTLNDVAPRLKHLCTVRLSPISINGAKIRQTYVVEEDNETDKT